MSILLVLNTFGGDFSIFCLIEDAKALPQSSSRRQFVAIAAGLCAEVALLAYGTGDLFASITLGACTSALLTWTFATSRSDDPQVVRQVAMRTVLGWALMLVTTVVVVPQLRRVHFFHALPGPFNGEPSGRYADPHRGAPRSEENGDSASSVHDAYSGIVLWPKQGTRTKLIAPSPTSWKERWFHSATSNPLIIPFDGVYWFFRAPDTHPPAKARDARGSPDMFDIHSTDWRPLSMEAHQNLGDLLDLSCCSRIEVAIRNADYYPGSVSVELVLDDDGSGAKISQSLGRQAVNSSRPWWAVKNHQPAASETLKFPIPPSGKLKRFDEITLIFWLDGYRARTGAKIGIDHFTLVPRGL